MYQFRVVFASHGYEGHSNTVISSIRWISGLRSTTQSTLDVPTVFEILRTREHFCCTSSLTRYDFKVFETCQRIQGASTILFKRISKDRARSRSEPSRAFPNLVRAERTFRRCELESIFFFIFFYVPNFRNVSQRARISPLSGR